MGDVFLEGMLLQASLIFALGPQNIFILESGLRKRHHITVSLVCFIFYLTLIMMGVAGAATLFNHYPEIKVIVGVAGVGFLILYGFEKIRFGEKNFIFRNDNALKFTLKTAILSAITFSIVNPHAYLDGIVLIGGYSSKFPNLESRLTLGLGAAFFSLLWFLGLSIGASVLMPFFQNAKRMRLMMGSAGVLLIILSVRLGADVYDWINELYPESMTDFHLKWK